MPRTATTYEQKTEWVKEEYGSLIGKKIKEIRPLTENECKMFAWDFQYEHMALVIIFTDGTCIIPSQDPEGNGAGHLFVERVG